MKFGTNEITGAYLGSNNIDKIYCGTNLVFYKTTPSAFILQNAEVIGTLTENNGEYSGFTTDDYIKWLNDFRPRQNTWEISFGFKLNSIASAAPLLCKYLAYEWLSFRVLFTTDDNLPRLYFMVPNSTIGYLFGEQGTHTIEANKLYYVKVAFDGSYYKMYISEDGETWELDVSFSSSDYMYDWEGQTLFGCFKETQGYDASWAFTTGSIDLTKAYYKIGNVVTTFNQTMTLT